MGFDDRASKRAQAGSTVPLRICIPSGADRGICMPVLAIASAISATSRATVIRSESSGRFAFPSFIAETSSSLYGLRGRGPSAAALHLANEPGDRVADRLGVIF